MAPHGKNTDLGALWTRTVNEYIARTGEDLSRFRVQSIGDVKSEVENDNKSFEKFRHRGDKTDRVRKAFGDHLGGMQKCLTGIAIVGNAAAAFPPAMPVTIVFAACGRLLGAFATVKADYNKVEDFFTQSGRFFERLSIIEGKTSDIEPLKAAIVRVFANQLEICGLVERRVTVKGARFKQWVSALWNEEDPDFAQAIGNMQATLNEFSEAVGLASFATIKDTKDIAIRIERTQTEGFTMLSTDIREMQQSNAADLRELAQSNAALAKALSEKSKKEDVEKDKRKLVTKGTSKGDVGDKKFKALRSIKTFFDGKSDVFPEWRDALKENIAQKEGLREVYVAHTGEWLTSDPIFQQWMKGPNRLLWVDGTEGIGKSLLTYASLQYLSSQGDGTSSVASFFFKEDYPVLQSAQNALACSALQIAEANPRYAEQVEARLQDDSSTSKSLSTWQRFFLAPFAEASHASAASLSTSGQLYLLFDGLDETHEQQRDAILQFLTDLTAENARVHVLVTSRSNESSKTSRLNCLSINITKARMLHDIRVVIKDRLFHLPRLKKFSSATKKAILKRVATKADGMLYVEHIMRIYSYIGREGAVRKELEHIPDNLEALYKIMLDGCRRNRTTEQFDALKRLFAWLAFSKRSLSLAEATELVKFSISEGDFDLEDEIIGRSSRILELSRTKYSEGDPKGDMGDDDNGDDPDEHEDELDEYKSASLTFQERSLRQYFKRVSYDAHNKDDLRTPASAAHYTIFTMCVDLLMDAAQAGRFADDRQLTSYAVKYWHEHFNELAPEVLQEAQVVAVLHALYKICSNRNNVANLFERVSVPSDVYPERTDGTSPPWHEQLSAWAAKALSLPKDLLGTETKAWAISIMVTTQDVLVPLCKAHIQNWLAEYDEWYILEAYRFAEASLKLSGRVQESVDDSENALLSVANAFHPFDPNFKALRSIGTKLWYTSENADDVQKDRIQTAALEYFRRSLDLNEENDFERGATILMLPYFHAERKEFKSAVDTMDQALEAFSRVNLEDGTVTQKQMDDLFLAWVLRGEKAEYYVKLDQKEAALQTFNEARMALGEETIGGYWLNQLISILDEKFDPDGNRLLMTIKSWSEKERTVWLESRLTWYADMSALDRIYRAAKLSDATSLVYDWLTAFGKTLPPRSLTSLNLKAALAIFHEKVLGDVESAKETLHSALDLQPRLDGSEEYVLQERISTIRMDLANLIFSQFRTSSDPKRKDALLNEMKGLPGMKHDDELRESHIGMLVANMLHIMGPSQDYAAHMNGIFKTCIDGLEDSVSWNDGSSLRLLAKVLSSLKGLEYDARISISSQFSIMDRTVFYGEDGSDESSGISNAEKKEETHETAEKATSTGSVKLESGPGIESNETVPPTEVTTNETSSALKAPSTTTSEEPDQDLADYPVECDGGCGRVVKSWTEPLYLCLICPNADLCEDCHAKRLAWNEPNADTQAAIVFCGEDHRYVKGPMKGWKGIKDGVIRIGSEEVTVKKWLKELKEERWPKAWEDYWLRQGGLKNIDVE